MELPFALLLFLVLIPLLSGLLLPLLAGNDAEKIKTFTLGITVINFFMSLLLLVGYDFSNSAEYGLVFNTEWFSSLGLTFSFGVDSISIWLILLTTFLMPIVILGSYSAVTERVREFYI